MFVGEQTVPRYTLTVRFRNTSPKTHYLFLLTSLIASAQTGLFIDFGESKDEQRKIGKYE